MDEATATPSDLTWDDVFAVCRMLGVVVQRVDDEELQHETYAIYRFNSFPTFFVRPEDLLEYITAEEHPLETKYANILRTKP